MLRSAIIKSHHRGGFFQNAFQNLPKTVTSSSSQLMISSRSFFWNSKSDDDDNGKKGGENKVEIKTDSSSSNTSDGEVVSSSSSSSSSSSRSMPVRLGYGDEAPRYPHLSVLPVINKPLFPGIITSVTVSDEDTIRQMEKISKSGGAGGYVSVFLRSNGTGVSEGGVIIEQPEIIKDARDLYNVGTFAQIHRVTRGIEQPDHTDLTAHLIEESSAAGIHYDEEDQYKNGNPASLILQGHRRIDLLSVDKIGPPIDATVSHWEKLKYKQGSDSSTDDTIRALSNEILKVIRELAKSNPLFRENIAFFPNKVDSNDPYRLADFAATLTTGSPEDLQAILEEKDAEMRLHKALVLLTKERELSKLQQEISRKVEEKMTETQRKYMLHEQLKSIKKELGMEKDDKEALITKYRKKLAEFSEELEEEVLETIESELEKLSTLEKNSSEFNVTRSYLDWLTSVPWGQSSEETFDIKEARRILDRDHYGMDEVKDTILQYIAVGKLKGSIRGKILCLVGPPGVGKTSIAESIADSLGRKFFRFSVGGLSDVSEIKGHRRTYVGAMPGKIIQCLKSTGANNPLVLIDEIDKLGAGYRGDPAAALLEVLDPSQNSSFRDHFLDVPVDISKVLFMCTANDLDTIPRPLLDRMEIISLSGYDVPEKVKIAEQYLLPKAMRDNGLLMSNEDDQDSELKKNASMPDTLKVEISAIEKLVRWYCREAGVRNLNKHIEKITRKLVLQIVAEDEGAELTDKSSRKSNTWVVSDTNLEEYVGKPIFTSDRLYEKDPLPHGIVMGLAWTSMGGAALYIETQAIRRGVDSDKSKGGGMLKVTGQLGNVMEESTQIAYTVARAKLAEVNPSSSYFDNMDIHMHVPEGATPKDGPSAGITMTTAMLSLALDKPIRNDLAMTGEISLTGKVLPVGGIKEKIMAARRAGIKCIILPSGCKRDFEEMPDYLKEGLETHFAEEYETVFDVAFSSEQEN